MAGGRPDDPQKSKPFLKQVMEGWEALRGKNSATRQIRTATSCCVLMLLVGMLAVEAYTYPHRGLNVLMWALAAAATGGAIGFLFGIPRVLQDGKPSDASASGGSAQTRYLANTNLEQISDWLTKIIVGISLVNANLLLEHFKSVARIIARGMTAASEAAAATTTSAPAAAAALGPIDDAKLSFSYALLIYFLVSGLFTGYLLTRLNLARLFSLADEFEERDRNLTTVDMEVILSEIEPGETPKELSPETQAAVDARLKDPDIGKSSSVAILLSDAKVYYAGKMPQQAIATLQKARALAPANTDALFYLCHIMLSQSDQSGGVELSVAKLLDYLVTLHAARTAAWKLLGYALLWDIARLGDAQAASRKYLALFPRDDGAMLNLACAIAHQQELKAAVGPADEAAVTEALELLHQVLVIDPAWHMRITKLLDDDLKAFAGNAPLQAYLDAARQAAQKKKSEG